MSGRAVSHRITIDAPVERVLSLVDSLKHGWSQWSPLAGDGVEPQYAGPERGVGASQTWNGRTGPGSITLEEAGPERIAYRTQMGTLRATGVIRLASDGDATRVEWEDAIEGGGSLLVRLMLPLMGGVRRRNLVRGLDTLKRIAEGA